MTKKPLNFYKEEKTRKKETDRWLERHFGGSEWSLLTGSSTQTTTTANGESTTIRQRHLGSLRPEINSRQINNYLILNIFIQLLYFYYLQSDFVLGYFTKFFYNLDNFYLIIFFFLCVWELLAGFVEYIIFIFSHSLSQSQAQTHNVFKSLNTQSNTEKNLANNFEFEGNKAIT